MNTKTEPEDVMLFLLKRIRTNVATIRSDMVEVKERLGLLEAGYSSVSRRVDRIGGELETVNRRCDAVQSTAK